MAKTEPIAHILERTLYIKSFHVKEYKTIIVLLSRLSVTIEDLKSILHVGNKQFEKISNNLINSGIVSKFRNRNETLFIIHKSFFDIEESCKQCDKHSFVEKVFEDKSVKICNCSEHSKKCIHDYIRKGKNLHKMLGVLYEKIGPTEMLRGGNFGKSYKLTHVDGWNRSKFLRFMLEQWKEKFPYSLINNTTLFRFPLQECYRSFKESGTENWRRKLKTFLTTCIDRSGGDILKMKKDLTNGVSITKAVKKDKKLDSLIRCKKHDILCSFCKEDGCYLEKNDIQCSDRTRHQMMEKYN